MQHLGEHVDLEDFLLRLPRQGGFDGVADLLLELVRLVEEGHAAEDHLGVGDRGAVLLGDRHDDDEDAVGGEHATVAQRDVGHLPQLDAVDEDHPRLLGRAEARAALVDVERQAVVALEDVLRRHAHRLGELGMQAQPLEVAVEWHHVAGPHEVQHQLDLLGVAVAGGVDGRIPRGDDVAADVVQAVDRLVHGPLVAGNRGRREDHRVALLELDLAVVAVGHPAQRREWLALGARGDDHDPVIGQVGDLPRPHQDPLGDLDVSQVATDADVLAHRAADQGDLAAESLGGVYDLLYAMNVRREARHHDAPVAAREHFLEVGSDDRLRRREALAVDVRGVTTQQQHALATQFRQPRDIGRRAVDRGLVELVVARDQDRAQLGAECHRGRVGDRVGGVDQLQRERPELERFARLDLGELYVPQLVLVELRAGHRNRQRPRIDGRVEARAELAEHPGKRAEVILVPVRDDDRLDLGRPLAQVGEVGQHEVDADHLRGREAQSHVDDDDPAVVFDDRHVLTDLAEPAERQDAQLAAHAGVPASRPWRSSISRTAASSSDVAGTSGSRSPPTSKPSMLRAAFVQVGFDVRNSVS